MSRESRPPARLRFGIFEVDVRSREVRKQGVRIKLQEQPFHVLKVLLERPGEIVTREELRSQIWSADTFVDFDNSLNTSINKLREALGDSADSPRFIETVPRRGYRFVAPVKGDTEKKREAVGHAQGFRGWRTGVVAAAVVIVVTVGLLWRSRQPRRLTEKDTIVLGDFANSTGDAVFDGTLREGLSVELEQSPFLSLLSEEGIHHTLRMMGQAANARLTPEIAQEVCQRTSSVAALQGSIALIGSRYNLILKAVNCASGDLLATTEGQANDKNHVLDALAKAASEMRRRLGESLSTVQKYNTPLEQATTPSLEALQAYNSSLNAPDGPAAIALLQRAIQLDPNFALAYSDLAYLAEPALAAESARKAFELRAGVSEREKLHIEVNYYYFGTGDLVKARRSAEIGALTYRRDPDFHGNLFLCLRPLGEYEAGLKENLEWLRLSVPDDWPPYRLRAFGYLYLNRIEEAEVTVKKAKAKGLDSRLTPVLYAIAFYRGDTSEMARQAARAAGKSEDEHLLSVLEVDTAAYFGHLRKAREFLRQAADSAQRAGEKENAATYYAASALREGLFGSAERAGQQANLAKRGSTGRDLDYGVALALAYAGDASQARALADDLGKRFPEDTIVQFNYLPTLRAKLALVHANPQEALVILGLPLLMNWGCPRMTFITGPICILSMCEEKRILRRTEAVKRQKNFRKSSSIVALCSTNPSVRWRICNSGAPTRCRATRPTAAAHIWIF
ncbi:MAG: hypothetical protein DMG77_05800 [Acidobacteria bacterium]|nr:MAG: hypothetical protein DMG77_05800 [Acidobacteriota bacterium]